MPRSSDRVLVTRFGPLLGLALALACADEAAYGGTGGSSSSSSAGASETFEPDEATSREPGESTGSASDTSATAVTSTSADTGADASDELGGSSTTAGGEAESDGASSTGEAPGEAQDVPFFADVTVEAGIEYVQGVTSSAPNCLIDQIGPGEGGYCTPERVIAGAATGDVDGDGWTDLFVTRTADTDILFRNNGDGTFTDVTAASGIDLVVHGSGAAFADIENDGDLDLYVASIAGYRYHLWINDGAGHFSEDALARGAALDTENVHVGMSVAVGDYDLDGYVDLYVGEWRTDIGLGDTPSHSRLLHNLGVAAPGEFEDVTDAAGVNMDEVWVEAGLELPGTYSFSPAFSDLDGDDYPELTIAADFATSRLFWNRGDGTFFDGTVAAGTGTDQNGMGSTLGDYDNDGDLDWYVTSITKMGDPDGNRFYRSFDVRSYEGAETDLGVGDNGWGWGALFFDANNDGDLDLAAANGYYFTQHTNDIMRLWSNDGETFVDDSLPAGFVEPRQRRGVLTFDYDEDGDLDLFVTVNGGAPELLRNENGNAGDWLRVRVVGTTSNREGIGARVSVRASKNAPTQLREIGTASHYMGQSERVAHFGMAPDDEPVAEVRVYWPASQQEQVFVDVARNSELVVEEP